MTLEEKAKAYDIALEKARKYHAAAKSINDPSSTRYENIFPELRENEDEKTRKELVEKITNLACGCFISQEQKQKFIAYLKKQEQKSNIEFIQRSWYLEGYFDRKYNREPMWLITTGEDGPKYELNPKYGKKLVEEQKPADDKAFEKWLDDWYQGSKEVGGDVVMSEAEFKNWSRGIKNMYQQESEEWSEENEEIIANAIKQLYNYANSYHNSNNDIREKEVRKVADELKSLRPSWKPSEEQMEALRYVAYEHGNSSLSPYSIANKTLASLYEQLKKL